jgi:NADH-quinone oxidoreductase subunit J
MQLVLFIVVAAICMVAALNLVIQKHPIGSALSLIVVMGSLAVLYLLLGAEFVFVIQLIVYAGAIMVLFVFVIMLLNAGEEARTRGSRVAVLFGVPAVIALVALVAWVFARKALPDAVESTTFHGSVQIVAQQLFTRFLLPFEVTSVLILIAIMGAVVLARRDN